MTDLIHDTINMLCKNIKESTDETEKKALIAALDTLIKVYFNKDSKPDYTNPDSPWYGHKIWVSDNTKTSME